MAPARRPLLLLAGMLAAALGLGPRTAHALVACTAADIVAQDPGCPASGPCSVTLAFDIGDGCVLDFGARDVTFTNNGDLLIGTNTVTIKGANVTLAPGAFFDGRSTTARGGVVIIEATGTVAVQRSGGTNARIDVSGTPKGGDIQIIAGGTVTLAGQIQSTKNSALASGGTVDVQSALGDILVPSGAELTVEGGAQGAGGSISFVAGGKVSVQTLNVDIVGGEGGEINVEAGAEVLLPKVTGTANGDAGSGGTVEVLAGTFAQLNGDILLNGTSSFIGGEDAFGGCGGSVDIEAQFGAVTVGGNVKADSGPPDGVGGVISLIATGAVNVGSGKTLSAAGVGTLGCGGELSIDAGLDVSLPGTAGPVDVSGGLGGGSVDMIGGRDVTVNRQIKADGTQAASSGGGISLFAGFEGGGTLTVTNTVSAGAGGCDIDDFCGDGGIVDLIGCGVSVPSGAVLTVTAPTAGDVTIVAQEQMTVGGTITALGTTATPTDGTITFQYRSAKPPIVTGSVTPAAIDTPTDTCTMAGQPNCLDPCPVCGNNTIEYPEQCDDGGAQSCDACSVFCRNETVGCDDGLFCTADSCDVSLGCRNAPLPNGTSCADGQFCNGDETCTLGLCFPGAPRDCSGVADQCHDGVCNETNDTCEAQPKAGTPPCEDGFFCTDGDTCSAGACNAGGPRDCSGAGDQCNDGVCNETTDQCEPQPVAGTPPCDDGLFCTENDACAAGVCTGSPIDCSSAGDQCNDGVCNDTTDQCEPQPKAGTPACDDGLFCSDGDTCSGGACNAGPARDCSGAGNQCNDGVCNEAADQCQPQPKPNGTPCDDGLFCFENETCTNGFCLLGSFRDCSGAGDQCNNGVCNETTDQCVPEPKVNGATCNDGMFCTVNDKCTTGVCGGAPRVCPGCNPMVCNETTDQCEPPPP